MSVLCIRGIVSVDEAAYTVSIREKEGIQMKKQFAALAGICCLILLLCSCAPKQNAVEEPTDNSNTTQVVPRSDSADSEDSEENTPAPESEAPPNGSTEDDGGSGVEEHTAEAYVFSVEGDTMYVDLENPGPRNYPGEGEDRKVAFDISGAEVIQTDISEVNPERGNPVRTAVIVSIDYHTVNGEYIADKITTDGQEHFFTVYMSKGDITAVSETQITVNVTEGDHAGETLAFDLTEWDPVGRVLTVGESVDISYYTKEGVHYVMSIAVP